MRFQLFRFVFVGILSVGVFAGCNGQTGSGARAVVWSNESTSTLSEEGSQSKQGVLEVPASPRVSPSTPPVPFPSERAVESENHSSADTHYASLQEVMAAEGKCMDLATNSAKSICLSGVTEWWFHEGGNVVPGNPYVSMIRVMQVQLALDPSDVETAGVVAYYQWSNDVSDIVDHVATDFSMRPLETMRLAERAQAQGKPANKDRYEFYCNAQDVPMLVVHHPQYGSLETKKVYYAELKRLHARGLDVWAATDRSGMSANDIAGVDRYNAVVDRFLVRNVRFDRTATPPQIPLPSAVPSGLPRPGIAAPRRLLTFGF